MDKEKSQKLITSYPLLYRKGISFACGDGWFDLIDRLSRQVEEMIAIHEPTLNGGDPFQIYATQVKEKYGTLSFYMSSAPDCVWEAIEKAEEESATICETCGSPGRIRKSGWIQTLCDKCA